ncbi:MULTISPECIES: inner membrane protein YpjD [unclassified Acinetobacter]|uniref:cytochrome C assembly family protein n=1 Tax=unclassified Acinetobacter TaxID=196816 RepID=UPI0035B8275C
MLLNVALTVMACVAYVVAFLYLLKHFLQKSQLNPFLLWSVLFSGLILHGLVLSMNMIQPQGIDYDVFNLISFTSGLLLLLGTCFSMYRPVVFMNLIATPVALIGLLLGELLHSPTQVIRQQGFAIDGHIILSLSAYAVLSMATIHAILIWLQNRELKKKQAKRLWVNILPSLQTMESLLFDLILIGFILLTAALTVGFCNIENFFGQHLAHKTVFSVMSWLIYLGLLVGRWQFGWRGNKAIRFSLIGFGFLALGFIGTQFVLQVILMRA